MTVVIRSAFWQASSANEADGDGSRLVPTARVYAWGYAGVDTVVDLGVNA